MTKVIGFAAFLFAVLFFVGLAIAQDSSADSTASISVISPASIVAVDDLGVVTGPTFTSVAVDDLSVISETATPVFIPGNTGGSKKKTTQEEGSHRIAPASNLQNLANTNNQNDLSQNLANSAPQTSRGFGSKITGAVIGVIGEKGALGVGIFLMVLGVATLVVYNRKNTISKKSK